MELNNKCDICILFLIFLIIIIIIIININHYNTNNSNKSNKSNHNEHNDHNEHNKHYDNEHYDNITEESTIQKIDMASVEKKDDTVCMKKKDILKLLNNGPIKFGPKHLKLYNEKILQDIKNKSQNDDEDDEYDSLLYFLKIRQYIPSSFDDGVTIGGNIDDYNNFGNLNSIGKILLGNKNFYPKPKNYIFSGIKL